VVCVEPAARRAGFDDDTHRPLAQPVLFSLCHRLRAEAMA